MGKQILYFHSSKHSSQHTVSLKWCWQTRNKKQEGGGSEHDWINLLSNYHELCDITVLGKLNSSDWSMHLHRWQRFQLKQIKIFLEILNSKNLKLRDIVMSYHSYHQFREHKYFDLINDGNIRHTIVCFSRTDPCSIPKMQQLVLKRNEGLSLLIVMSYRR